MGGDNVRMADDVCSSRRSFTSREKEVPLTLTVREESQVIDVEPIVSILPNP
ncbi:OLC1v1036564C1 [Oldenlandia corymbosa var. corymbosa]|uniref:OLC1v1036564C1 n=1 Tax=Oldenlandia corymbosa var. corymbosa TaxID=529605 RepID=A0AAV1CVL5_OLDCO|nr:OLC1v1036564C1 [Oldenlandia corymbosa var. corymbosa]